MKIYSRFSRLISKSITPRGLHTPWLRSCTVAVAVLAAQAVAHADTLCVNPGGTGGCSATIQGAIDAATSGDTVEVQPGTYDEDVNVNKANLSLVSTGGAAGTTIRGPIGGSGTTVEITASNVTVAGFTITRAGNNTTDWNDPSLNTAGINIVGQAVTGALIRDNIITGNRTGININNSNGHTVRNNLIDFNRGGLIYRNQTDNQTLVENVITNNWTVGILFLDASGGTNVPSQSARNSTFSNNNISGNWYAQVADRQTGGALPAPNTTNLKNFIGNWWGTSSPVVTTANSAEPGYASQIPVAYGGSATPPGGQPDIAGPASANIKYLPLLSSGTDTDIEIAPGRGTNGFQPAPNLLTVWPGNLQSWVIANSGGGSTGFVAGPATPPLYGGSGQLSVGADGNDASQFRQPLFNGMRLADLTELKYSTYTSNDGSSATMGDQTPYIIIGVDLDANGTQDTLLFFEPEYQHGFTATVPDQGDNVMNTWQTWDALAGGWWAVTGEAGANPGAGVKTLSTILASYPNALIFNSTTVGSLRVVTGFGAGVWDNYVGNVDAVKIGFNGARITYNFDHQDAVTPALTIDDVTLNEGDSGTTTYTFTVSLSTPVHGGVSFDIATQDGTAQDDNPGTEDNDYTANSATGVSIPNGQQTAQFTVQVNGDTVTEHNETFAVNVTNVIGASVTDGQGLGTINTEDPFYTISGYVRTNTLTPIPGVSLTRTGSATPVTTDASGYYVFTGVVPGLYTLTPTKAGYTFTPPSQGLRVSTAGRGANFVGKADGINISGRLMHANGSAIVGATVTADTGQSATTNSAGYYTLLGIPDGTRILTPSKATYTFSPATRSVTVSGANLTNQNFIGSTGFTVSGRIATSGGIGISGATVTLDGGATAVSNSAGYYTFYNVANGQHSLVATKAGYSFVPTPLTVVVDGANVSGRNFVGS